MLLFYLSYFNYKILKLTWQFHVKKSNFQHVLSTFKLSSAENIFECIAIVL